MVTSSFLKKSKDPSSSLKLIVGLLLNNNLVNDPEVYAMTIIIYMNVGHD
jgi:hypothetical protein